MANTDTVFPDTTEPMTYSQDENYIYSPGVDDDTVCLVIKYNLTFNRGILFVANSCEEGLGNLKGVKQIMSDYAGRIHHVYTFDDRYHNLICKCVGSHRYKISIETEGGHSFADFGKTKAICVAAEFIHNLNQCIVPQEGDSKTTYNVGLI